MKRTDLSKKPFIILTIFFIISLFSFSCSARTIDKYEQDESSYTVETLTYEEFIERIRNDFGEKAALEAKSDIKRIKNDINTARQSSQLTYKVYSETKPFRPNVDFKSQILGYYILQGYGNYYDIVKVQDIGSQLVSGMSYCQWIPNVKIDKMTTATQSQIYADGQFMVSGSISVNLPGFSSGGNGYWISENHPMNATVTVDMLKGCPGY